MKKHEQSLQALEKKLLPPPTKIPKKVSNKERTESESEQIRRDAELLLNLCGGNPAAALSVSSFAPSLPLSASPPGKSSSSSIASAAAAAASFESSEMDDDEENEFDVFSANRKLVSGISIIAEVTHDRQYNHTHTHTIIFSVVNYCAGVR